MYCYAVLSSNIPNATGNGNAWDVSTSLGGYNPPTQLLYQITSRYNPSDVPFSTVIPLPNRESERNRAKTVCTFLDDLVQSNPLPFQVFWDGEVVHRQDCGV